MFFSKRACNAPKSSSRCFGDNSFLLLVMIFILLLQIYRLFLLCKIKCERDTSRFDLSSAGSNCVIIVCRPDLACLARVLLAANGRILYAQQWSHHAGSCLRGKGIFPPTDVERVGQRCARAGCSQGGRPAA